MPEIESIAVGRVSLAAEATPAGRLEGTKESPAALADAAKQFEALLITELLRAARGDSEGWMGAGEDQTAASAMELAEEQFAGALAAQGGLGMASLIISGLERR
jgi:Rod binding domain-containing protein